MGFDNTKPMVWLQLAFEQEMLPETGFLYIFVIIP